LAARLQPCVIHKLDPTLGVEHSHELGHFVEVLQPLVGLVDSPALLWDRRADHQHPNHFARAIQARG
jgi:hypothetical protein